MKYKKIDVGPYNIHLINTNKFKTVTIKINFKRKVKKSEITKRSLLSRILLESSMNYKSSRLLEIKIEELYNLSLNSSSYISGNYSVLSLSSIFLNVKYTEKNQVKNSIEFILDILLNPNVENNKFNKDSFNFAVSSLKEELESQCDNPSFYSELRANEETDKKASFSYNATGYLDDLLKIDEKNLYSYYKSVLKSDLVDVFIIGDIDEEEIKKISYELKTPSGRMETIRYNNSSIVIDYAHTPDAIEKIINTMKEVTKGNIYTVFGCTGDRDRTKRPIMLKLVTSLSRYAIVTNDDPHFEDPIQIVNDMISGVEAKNYEIILDRKQAIRKGISLLKEYDTLLILGKGHEEYMIIKDKKIPFKDSSAVEEILNENMEMVK